MNRNRSFLRHCGEFSALLFEMVMRRYVWSGPMQAKPDLLLAAAAQRKYFALYRRDLVWERMIISVQLVMDHIVDAGQRRLVPGFEFFKTSHKNTSLANGRLLRAHRE